MRIYSFISLIGIFSFIAGVYLGNPFKAISFEPDVIILDGQGIAHPRNMGMAHHLTTRDTLGFG